MAKVFDREVREAEDRRGAAAIVPIGNTQTDLRWNARHTERDAQRMPIVGQSLEQLRRCGTPMFDGQVPQPLQYRAFREQ